MTPEPILGNASAQLEVKENKEENSMNQMKPFILMALLTVLLVWLGSVVGGRNGAIFALVFAGVMNFGVYWFSDRIVLKMYRAQAVTEAQEPKLHRIVREFTLRGGTPTTQCRLIP